MCVEMHWILNFIKTYNMKILQVAFVHHKSGVSQNLCEQVHCTSVVNNLKLIYQSYKRHAINPWILQVFEMHVTDIQVVNKIKLHVHGRVNHYDLAAYQLNAQ